MATLTLRDSGTRVYRTAEQALKVAQALADADAENNGAAAWIYYIREYAHGFAISIYDADGEFVHNWS